MQFLNIKPGRPLLGGLGLVLGLFGVELAALLILNGGHFIYTVDDAYIHLALAENIARGHYGVNLAEVSAPSSSALWPFLLTPFFWTPFAALTSLVPLFLNVAAALATVVVFHALLVRALGQRIPGRVQALLLFLMALAANLTALAFTGMEHSLQILLTAAAALGLGLEAREDRVPAWLPWVLILGPLVRYENAVLSLAVAGYLLYRRRYAAGTIVVAGIALLLGGFSLWLVHLGLGPLPTSVLAKSPDVTLSFPARFLQTLRGDHGGYLTVFLLLLIGKIFFPGEKENRALAVTAALVTAAHLFLAAGRESSFDRYETYVWVFSGLSLLWLCAAPLRNALAPSAPDRHRNIKVAALLILLTAVVGDRTIVNTLTLPFASNDIYRQQYQMHRFVTEYYRKPVAVNDLGWASYRNDVYVLDLWGLASPDALRHRLAGGSPAWMDSLARAQDVGLVMIYKGWFTGGVPASWIHVGSLRRAARSHPGGRGVDFYAVDDTARAEVSKALMRFRGTLPANASFVFEEESGAP